MAAARAPKSRKLLEKRIPTLMGLALLVAGIVAGITLLGQGTGGFLPRASEDAIPKQVRITNVTDSSFSISFITDAAAPGTLVYGTDRQRQSTQVRDDRDQLTGSATPFRTHHITVRNLNPNTQYYLKLGTGGRSLYDNNGQPFSVRTAARISDQPEARTVYGTVRNEGGNPAAGSLLFIAVEGGGPLSALVQENGSWALSISQVRTTDGSGFVALRDDLPAQVQVQGERSGLTLSLSTTVGQMAPLAPLQFGIDPGAAVAVDETPDEPAQPQSQSQAAQSSIGVPASGLSLSSPARDDEIISTTTPQFFGSADLGSTVQVIITPADGVVQVGIVNPQSDRRWSWTPPTPLAQGSAKIVVAATDSNGRQQTIERRFSVSIAAAGTGTLPAFTASTGGQLNLAASSPVPTPSPLALASPIASASPTPKPSPTPTAIATASARVTQPVATTSSQPVSGSTKATFAATATGIGLLILGAAFWLLAL